MNSPFQAMLWALAIIFVTMLAARDTIDQGSATTLMIVMPLLASMQLSGRLAPCKLAGGRD